MRPTSIHSRTMNLASRFHLILVAAVAALLIITCSPPGGGGGGGTPQVATPVITPGNSAAFEQDLPITVTCGTGGAVIWYTTDGSDPSATNPTAAQYTGAIPGGTLAAGAGATVKAIGILAGYTDSVIASAVYTMVQDTIGPVPVMSSEYDSPGVVASAFDLTITFNEDVAPGTFDAGDIGFDPSLVTVGAVSGGPLVFHSTITPLPAADDQTFTLTIAADACQDDYSNNSQAAAPFSLKYDKDAPIGAFSTGASNPTNASTITVTISFGTVNVTGFTVGDLVVSPGTVTLSNFATTVPDSEYTVDLGNLPEGTVTLDLPGNRCSSTPGNVPNLASPQFSIVHDGGAPYVSSITPVSGGMSDSNPLAVQIDWSEDVTGFDEADITPTLSNCTIQALSWTAVSGSRYTFNLIPQSEAAYGFQIDPGVCTDLALNPSTGTTAWSHTYNLAPVVGSFDMTDGSDSGSSSSDDITNVTTPSFTGTTSKDGTLEIVSDVNGVVYTGSVTAGAWGPVTVSALTSSGQTGTVHSMTARVKDSNNVTGTSAPLPITIDVTAPTAGTPDLDAASDLGASSSDDVTSDDTPAFSGTSNEGGTLELRNDGSGIVYTGAVTGDWTNRTVSALSGAGQTGTDHLIDARVTDAAGNASGWSGAVSVRIDTTAPAVGSLDMTDASDSGSSNTDNVTNVNTPAFTGTTNESGSFAILSSVNGTVYTGSVTNGSWGPCTVSALDSTGQAGRAHTITARVTDLAGNDGTDTLAVTIDTTGPVVGMPDMDTASDSGSSIFDNITNVTTPSFSGTSNEGGALTLRSSVDGTIYTGSITGDWTNRTSTVTLDSTGQTGRQHDVDAQAMDVAGNTGSWSSALTIWIDTTAPAVTVEQGSTQTDPTRNSPISFDVTFVESVYDFATGDVSFTGSTAGGTLADAVSGSGASYTVTVTGMTTSGTVIASLADGVARDTAGNPSAASSSSDNSVTWYTVEIISAWSSSTTGTINNLAKPAGNNRLLLVFAGNRRSNNGARTVSSITWGGRTLTYLGETSNGANPSLTNSVYYLNEAGIAAATAPSDLVVTWSGAPTAQQEWAVFLQNVNQTTPFANLQQGASTTTNVTAAAVNYGMCDMGFITVSSITTAGGAYTINTSGFTLDVDQSAFTIWDMMVGHQTFYASGSFTPDVTRATSNKQRLQGFIIQVY